MSLKTNLNYKKMYAVILGVILLLLLVYYFAIVLPKGELGQKKAWSVLQGVELEHRRDLDIDNTIILEKAMQSDYDLLGIPIKNQNNPRAWLVLNKIDANNKIIMLPENQILTLSCDYVNELPSTIKVKPEVLTFLLRVCDIRGH